MLLSKALKMQQDLEDKKHEVIIENLENKIKEQSVAIEKKDFELQTTEGLLADAEAKITELNSKLLSQSENFEQEKLKLDAKLEAEVQKSSELKESLTSLQNKCLEFSNRCVQRLKQVFYFVGASSEKFTPLVEDLPGAFEHIEGEINDLDEVIAGHGDFCALVDLYNIPNLARSIANRFIKLVWTKGGRSKAGDEARSHLKPVTKSYLMLTFSFEF
jgi:chromosome segregation ATPase